jgi:hypothetical protein
MLYIGGARSLLKKYQRGVTKKISKSPSEDVTGFLDMSKDFPLPGKTINF